MIENLIVAILLIAFGIACLGSSIRRMKDYKYLKNYIKTSPSRYSFLMRNIFGVKKAIKIGRYLAPVEIILSIVIILIGILMGIYALIT